MAQPKTPSEHFAFLEGLAALKVQFALDWVRSHPGWPLSRALKELTFLVNLGDWNRAGIFNHLDLSEADEGRWRDFLAAADRALLGRESSPPTAAEILSLLPVQAALGPRVDRDLADLHHPTEGLAASPAVLWTNDPPWNLALPEDPQAPRILEFHMANACYPESFLRSPERIRRELRALAFRAREQGFEALGTRSWLNDHPAWVAFFPPVWAERRTPAEWEDVGGHLGVWGQVLTARLTLSSHAEAYLRTHQRFEFAMRASWATVDELLEWTEAPMPSS